MKEDVEDATSQKYCTFEAIKFIKRDCTFIVRVRLDASCILLSLSNIHVLSGIYTTLIVHNFIIMTLQLYLKQA